MTIQTEGTRTSPRVPPHSIEAEESVLGAIMLSPDAVSLALERIASEQSSPKYSRICSLILEGTLMRLTISRRRSRTPSIASRDAFPESFPNA